MNFLLSIFGLNPQNVANVSRETFVKISAEFKLIKRNQIDHHLKQLGYTPEQITCLQHKSDQQLINEYNITICYL